MYNINNETLKVGNNFTSNEGFDNLFIQILWKVVCLQHYRNLKQCPIINKFSEVCCFLKQAFQNRESPELKDQAYFKYFIF